MWPNPQETADLVTFIEEILNGKLHFLSNEYTTTYDIDIFSNICRNQSSFSLKALEL